MLQKLFLMTSYFSESSVGVKVLCLLFARNSRVTKSDYNCLYLYSLWLLIKLVNYTFFLDCFFFCFEHVFLSKHLIEFHESRYNNSNLLITNKN